MHWTRPSALKNFTRTQQQINALTEVFDARAPIELSEFTLGLHAFERRHARALSAPMRPAHSGARQAPLRSQLVVVRRDPASGEDPVEPAST